MADNLDNRTPYLLGIDVGSTTVKTAVLSPEGKTLFTNYERHFSKVREASFKQLQQLEKDYGKVPFKVCITGSAGLGLAEKAKLPFVQEVQGAFLAVQKYYPQADVVIELGGEDAKIIFLTGGLEERMNGSCAGGTGAFIDQMAALLDVDIDELDAMSLKAEKVYPIASRCGVFAKSDIQPLLNQGARREDVAMSIYRAVVDQTLSGLAQGREIKGKVLFLGGPLFYLKGLQKAFVDRLKLTADSALFPPDAEVFMALGAAIFAGKGQETYALKEIEEKIRTAPLSENIIYGQPLFNNEAEYEKFKKDHEDFKIIRKPLETYAGKAYLGIDAGSTTTKLVLLSENHEILFSSYDTNKGQPIDTIVRQLKEIYAHAGPGLDIVSSAVTGYGENLIKSCLKVDYGLVETVAHYKAASYFEPDVDFIIDIGGQDIKCFRIKNHAIDSIMLNEACSSGCGSFIQTFANAMGMGVADFAKLGLFAKHPVELGTRCTVFMNSSVKQAQKEGASLEDISAGLSSSIVKNAIYKVIRFRSADELGNKIVCQGGTFLNDAILRAFELETGKKAIRPTLAGLMGAFGAALYAQENGGTSSLITKDELAKFSYRSLNSICQGCGAHCSLTIILFNDKRSFISGNKCEKGEGRPVKSDELDLYAYKYKRLLQLKEKPLKPRARVGLPLALAMYEQLPFWDAFFTSLGFETVISEESNRDLYFKGQHTIPSDTVCYPAKLMHGHVESLLDKGVDFIFYPAASYNLDEGKTVNHFNCPVVAYYGELLKKNNLRLNEENFLDPMLDLNNLHTASRNLEAALSRYHLPRREIKKALQEGFKALDAYHADIRAQGDWIIEKAREEKKQIIVLAGRPYHIDPEISHGVDKLINSLDMAVLSEDSVAYKETAPVKVNVLNQWTYHARLYEAAKYVTEQKDMQLVQLVSFGCGVDAVTADEVRRILEGGDKFYTQLKIDEINNLGAVRIRLRSLKAAIEEKERNQKDVGTE
jgi:predicted CoA-substrate-specific enzyme activase